MGQIARLEMQLAMMRISQNNELSRMFAPTIPTEHASTSYIPNPSSTAYLLYGTASAPDLPACLFDLDRVSYEGLFRSRAG